MQRASDHRTFELIQYGCDHTDEAKRRRTHSKESICDFLSSGNGAPSVRAPELDRIRLFTFGKEKVLSITFFVSHELLPFRGTGMVCRVPRSLVVVKRQKTGSYY